MSDTSESVRDFIDELSILSYGHIPAAMRMLERYAELLKYLSAPVPLSEWEAMVSERDALKARVEELSAWEESWRRQSEELKALVAELEADAKGPVYDDQLPRFKRTHWTQGEEGEW